MAASHARLKTISKVVPHLLSLVCVYLAFTGVGCSDDDGDCTEQPCDQYGGSASRKLMSCYTSGSGSTKDVFVLKDQADKQFYTCSRAADDSASCGVELISAKQDYCKAGGPAGTTSSSTSSSSSSGATSSGGSSSSSSGGSSSGGSSASSSSSGSSSGGSSSGGSSSSSSSSSGGASSSGSSGSSASSSSGGASSSGSSGGASSSGGGGP